MTGKQIRAPGLSKAVQEWLIHEAKWGVPSGESAMRATLEARKLTCPEPLLHFERCLADLALEVQLELQPPAPMILALAQHEFGVMWAVSRHRWESWLDHDGQRLICMALGPQGDLFMAPDGAIFRRAPKRAGPVPLAHTATAYLQRLVRIAMLGEPLRLEFAGRSTAAALAEVVGLPEDQAASDDLQRLWGDDGLLLLQGAFHEPGRDVCHAHASQPGAARLVEAARMLGVRGAFVERLFVSRWKQEIRRAEAAPALDHPRHFEHRPLVGRGGGFIACVPPSPGDTPDHASIEQVCIVDGHVIERLCWPERSCVKFTPSAEVEGLSACGHGRMRRLGIYRDPRLVAGPEALRERLVAEGLPAHELVFEIERLMGGLRRLNPAPMGALHFGCHALLVGSMESEHQWDWADESEDLDGVWPRLSYRGEPVVPVGGGLETIILAGDGRLWRFDFIGDEVCPLPSAPLVVLESELLTLAAIDLRSFSGVRGLGWQLKTGGDPALVAAEMGLTPVSYASEGAFRWWQARDQSAYLRADQTGAWLVAQDDAVVRIRRAFQIG